MFRSFLPLFRFCIASCVFSFRADDLVNELTEDLPTPAEPVKRVSVAPILKHLGTSPRRNPVVSVRRVEADQSSGGRKDPVPIRLNITAVEGTNRLENRRIITLNDSNCSEPVSSTSQKSEQVNKYMNNLLI